MWTYDGGCGAICSMTDCRIVSAAPALSLSLSLTWRRHKVIQSVTPLTLSWCYVMTPSLPPPPPTQTHFRSIPGSEVVLQCNTAM